MRGNELLDKMELIDPAYVEAADAEPKKKRIVWLKWGTLAAACLCVIVGVAAMIPYFSRSHVDPQPVGSHADPQPGGIHLSEKTTAKVSYGRENGAVNSMESDLVYFTEEEMFARENQYIFRGWVSSLTTITIDFNGHKEVRCIATVTVEKVYQGDISADAHTQLAMLLPCAVDIAGMTMEETDVITQLRCGMEGIFMPWIYGEDSRMEHNGAVLMMRDLASCGLTDGMRWAFLAADRGVIFDRNAYPGASGAADLDDIEAYVIEMLK